MKNILYSIIFVALLLFVLITLGFGCTNRAEKNKVTLTLGAYTVPKEVYQKEIIPSFKRYWKDKTGEDVDFYESYVASGAQSRAILEGFDADIAALSLEKHISKLKDADLITHDWKIGKYNGFITRSVVVIGFREGNPKEISSWEDLKREDISILYPSPKTSGGAMWDILAIYGAGLKTSELSYGFKDFDFAKNFLKSIQKRVKVMDKSGRESITTFENGIGDAIISYENELLLRQKEGKNLPFIVPEATILIENPIALIDKNVDKHKNRRVAEAFIEFLYSKDIQMAFSEYGFRPVDEEVMKVCKAKFKEPKQLFNIEYFGGWDRIEEDIFGNEGVWPRIMEELADER